MGRFNPTNSDTKSNTESTGGRFVKLLADKQKGIDTQKSDLIAKGEPVALSKDKVKPSFVGSIVRDIIKPVADVGTNIVNAGQIAVGAKETQPFSGRYLGKVEGLGKLDTTKGLTPENIKTLKKSASTGAELASYLTYGGVGKDAITGIAKQTAKEFIKTSGVKLAKEGALTGLAQSVGSQGRENADKGTPFSLKKTAQDVALSTILTPIASFGLNKIFGKAGQKAVSEATPNITPETAIANKGDISVPTPKIDSGATKITDSTIPPSVTPTIAPSTTGVNPIDTITKPIQDTTNGVPTKAATDINSSLVSSGIDSLPPEQLAKYNPVDIASSKQKITDIFNTNPDVAYQAAITGNNIPEGVHGELLYKAVVEKANREGNIDLQMALAKSPLATTESQAGQTLRLAQEYGIKDGTDAVAIMRDLNKELAKTTEKKLGKPLRLAQEELVNNAEVGFKNEVKKITSKQSVADFINSIPDC